MDNLWIWATVGAAFFQALRYAGLKALNQRLSTMVTTYVRVLFTLPVLVVYLVGVLWWTGESLPALSRPLLIYSTIAAVAQFVGTVLVVRLFQLGNFAVATLVIKADVIMTALIGTAFFSESITVVGWIAIIMTMIGVGVTSLGRVLPVGGASTGPGIGTLNQAVPTMVIGTMSALLYALGYLCLREGLLTMDSGVSALTRAAFGVTLLTVVSAVLVGAYLLVTEPRELKRMFEFQKMCWFVGVFSAFGSIGWFLASALTNASYVAAVAQVQIVFTLLISYFYFGERIRPMEIIGIVVIVAGLIVFRTA